MENEKKSKQPGQQPWSVEKQRAFNKMALLQQSVEKARTQEEVNEARKKLRQKENWLII